jgi:hypothetical protein
MRVKVRLLNYHGRPLLKDERARGEEFTGMLTVCENRQHRFGRVVTSATLSSQTAETSVPILELHDAVLLWIDAGHMRLRGFEIHDLVEYAQTWAIEVL